MRLAKICAVATLICAASATRVAPDQGEVGGNFEKRGLDLDGLKKFAQAAGATLEKQVESAKAQILSEARKLVDKAKENLREKYGLNGVPFVYDHQSDDQAVMDFGDTMRACSRRDCKNQYFIKEVVRWFRKALVDVGIFIAENPKATAALFIGVSVLTNLASGGALVPLALDVIGFGSRGPVTGSIAALVQRQIGQITVGSVFAQLQSAAMGGAAMAEIQKLAMVAFAGVGAIGAMSVINAGSKPFGETTDFAPSEWRDWEKDSRVGYDAKVSSKMMHMWGPVTAETCVAYGYREYRAQIWHVPQGTEAIDVCLQTPASIQGIGFKTPLGCKEEGPKKGVIATWYVHSKETRCMPSWSNFEDEGCKQYGRRRRFARLVGLRREDDWNAVCESTPARIEGRDYDGPTYCDDKGVLGLYGVFDTEDAECECYCAGG